VKVQDRIAMVTAGKLKAIIIILYINFVRKSSAIIHILELIMARNIYQQAVMASKTIWLGPLI
jgi:hypothetical protein